MRSYVRTIRTFFRQRTYGTQSQVRCPEGNVWSHFENRIQINFDEDITDVKEDFSYNVLVNQEPCVVRSSHIVTPIHVER